ncbi:MAG: MmcQ/YjbR family DNA-binding protein [Dysgonamonadaceae bacterium]|jgi:predicted DNA-binding protein (MmcQ/YjbR family)|nr:MmcQ/YjbR family DNA-binding protein [Dysgonamonadaceae bacterium]
MNIEQLYEYCISRKGAVASFPFDETSLVLKVCDKMFALIPLDEQNLQISLKCDPAKATELREKYPCVEPAYHFNKKYWNTVFLNRQMKDDEIKNWICHSIDEVIKKLPKKVRDEYYQD